MTVKLAVIYYSATSTTYQLARAIEAGAQQAGADVRFRKVKELAPDQAIQSNQGWAAHALETQNVPEASLDDLDGPTRSSSVRRRATGCRQPSLCNS